MSALTASLTDAFGRLDSKLASERLAKGRSRAVGNAATRAAVSSLSAAAKRDAARAALNARDARVEAEHYKRFTRLFRAMAELTDARYAATHGDASAIAAAAALTREVNALWRQPIIPADIAPTGRLTNRARTILRTYATRIASGDMYAGSIDASDLMMSAAARCYSDAHDADRPSVVASDAATYWRDRNNGATVAFVPTLGGMYRNIRREYARILSDYRRDVIAAAAITLDSDAALSIHAPSGTVLGDPSMLDWDNGGIVTVRRAAARSPYWDDMEVAERANIRADKRAKREARDYAATRAITRSDAARAITVSHLSETDAAYMQTDAECIALLSLSVPTDALCEHLGISPAALFRRIRGIRITDRNGLITARRLESARRVRRVPVESWRVLPADVFDAARTESRTRAFLSLIGAESLAARMTASPLGALPVIDVHNDHESTHAANTDAIAAFIGYAPHGTDGHTSVSCHACRMAESVA